MGQKRGRDPKASAAQANKRTKAVKTDDANDNERSVTVEELNWKEVAMPDRMEDAEGFFGLEEIDGIDIIKQSGGEVQFRVRRYTLFLRPMRSRG
jgi:ATP-dependent RNA helicase DDX24/MAK5